MCAGHFVGLVNMQSREVRRRCMMAWVAGKLGSSVVAAGLCQLLSYSVLIWRQSNSNSIIIIIIATFNPLISP